VFQVQGDIAEKVAKALQVALTPATEQALAAQPTKDLAAYDAYLRGVGLQNSGNAPVFLRAAIASYVDAVRRDSTFALAWARMGLAYSLIVANTNAAPAVADSADRATARALALAPELPDAHAARAYYYSVARQDNARALEEAEAGLKQSPNDVALLRAAARAEASLGRWTQSADRLQHAMRIDPRDVGLMSVYCEIQRWRRDLADAAPVCMRALEQRPDNLVYIEAGAMLAIAQGDFAGAQRVVHAVPPTVDQSALVAYFGWYWDLAWVLDSAQQARLLTVRPEVLDGDRASWAIVLAQVYALHGDRVRTRIYADSARIAYEAQLQTSPNDPARHAFRGFALAYLGRSAEAIQEAEHAVALAPLDKDARNGAYYLNILARVYLMCGQPEKAMDVLEALMKVPFYMTPAWFRIDPAWAALKGNPRFARLTAGT
jgi:tetratricopeptide (TPR) repeat protein